MEKRKIWKIVFIIIGILLFLFLDLIDNTSPLYEISVKSDGVETKIKVWHDSDSKRNFLFLPSYVDDVQYYSIQSEMDDSVQIVKSANVSTMYISTSTGTMQEVYNKKKHKEQISMVLYNEYGEIDCVCNDVMIKGHGSTSWTQDKKPFKLIFLDSISLLGLDDSTEFILQANAYDPSNLKNVIVMEFVKKLGNLLMSDYRFVDVYLNGEYNGLYVLVQSVEDTLKTKVDLEDLYLAVSDSTFSKKEESKPYFKIEEMISGEVKLPKTIEAQDLNRVEAYFNQIDVLVKKDNIENIWNYLDLETWVYKYLIDEIFENVDSGIRSNYFYWSNAEDNPMIYAGPIWDYDHSMGFKGSAVDDPQILFAAQKQRSVNRRIMWYGYLYENQTFYNSIVQRYRDEVRSILDRLVKNEINKWNSMISAASHNNSIRWGYTDFDDSASIIEWINKRIQFLDSIWIEGEQYCCVTLKQEDGQYIYWCYVSPGECLKDYPMFDTYFNEEGENWIIDNTQEKIDFAEPIYQDLTICKVKKTQKSFKNKIVYNSELLIGLAWLGILGIMMTICLLKELRNQYFSGLKK